MSMLSRLRELGRASRRQRPLPGRGIVAEETADGTRLHAVPPVEWAYPEAGSYRGPFAGRITGAGQVTVGGLTPDMVTAGRLRLEMETPQVVNGIDGPGYVYLDVQVTNLAIEYDPVLSVQAGFAATYPAQMLYGDGYPGGPTQGSLAHLEDVTHRYQVVIGEVGWDSAAGVPATWVQYHFGHLQVALRPTYLMYDDTARVVWYIARHPSGAVSRYLQSVPVSTHATVYYDPTTGTVQVGGSTGHEIGAIHTGSGGELLGLYQYAPPIEN